MTTKSSTSPSLVSDLSEIATPALLIDLPTVERNIRKMAEYVRSHGLDLRPHIKTHKSLSIARLQAQAGAKGLTVAKVGEAEVMSEVSDGACRCPWASLLELAARVEIFPSCRRLRLRKLDESRAEVSRGVAGGTS